MDQLNLPPLLLRFRRNLRHLISLRCLPRLIRMQSILVTGGKGLLTQWVCCEFVVSFEAVCPVITQWVCGEFF